MLDLRVEMLGRYDVIDDDGTGCWGLLLIMK